MTIVKTQLRIRFGMKIKPDPMIPLKQKISLKEFLSLLQQIVVEPL